MHKLLATGRTDLLDKFISLRTRRPFKAHLAWDAAAGKVNFEFEQRESKYPARKSAAGASKTGAASAGGTSAAAKKAIKTAAGKTTPAKAAAKTPRKASTAAGKTPSAALAAVIGPEPVARTEAMKKIWDYIKAHNLQDPQDKRTIVADDRLRAVLGQDRVGMFALAGILGQHLG